MCVSVSSGYYTAPCTHTEAWTTLFAGSIPKWRGFDSERLSQLFSERTHTHFKLCVERKLSVSVVIVRDSPNLAQVLLGAYSLDKAAVVFFPLFSDHSGPPFQKTFVPPFSFSFFGWWTLFSPAPACEIDLGLSRWMLLTCALCVLTSFICPGTEFESLMRKLCTSRTCKLSRASLWTGQSSFFSPSSSRRTISEGSGGFQRFFFAHTLLLFFRSGVLLLIPSQA